jgi:hypothetical protein
MRFMPQNASGTSRGPNLMRSTLVRHDSDGSAITSLIQSGSAHKIQLNPAQMKDVVSFIESAVQTYDRTSRRTAAELPSGKTAGRECRSRPRIF